MIQPTPEQITSWVDTNISDYKSRRDGEEIVCNNPFDDDTGYNFNISTIKACCNDWRGNEWTQGYSQTFLRFVQLYRNCSFAQAVKEVCGQEITIKSLQNRLKKKVNAAEKEKQESRVDLPSNQPLLSSKHKKLANILVNWLRSRGLNEEKIRLHDIRHAGGDVLWPYYEYDELVYWQSRNHLNKIFMFPPASVGVTKGMFLYGFDLVEPSDYLIITEAIFDSITLGHQCTATGGATITGDQAKKIRALNPTKGIILAPDNDKAGLKSLKDNYFLLRDNYNIYYSLPPQLKHKDSTTSDWNEIGQCIGFNKVRGIFEDNINPLTIDLIANLRV